MPISYFDADPIIKHNIQLVQYSKQMEELLQQLQNSYMVVLKPFLLLLVLIKIFLSFFVHRKLARILYLQSLSCNRSNTYLRILISN